MPEREPLPIPFHRDDLIYETDQLMRRISPKQRYDIAIIASVVALSLTLILVAATLRPRALPAYSFSRQGATTFVWNNRTGEVAACTYQGGGIVCSETDSPVDAYLRRLSDQDEIEAH
jgi:hypothetical protein